VDTDEISFLKEELYKLKRRVRKLEDREKQVQEDSGDRCSQGEMLKLIQFLKNPYTAAKTVLGSLFTEHELFNHSVSGKAPHSKIKATPK
jgi:hypothetical protein